MTIRFTHPKLIDISDEHRMGNPIMVATNYGWAFDPSPDHCSALHVRGFDTVRELRAAIKTIKPCPCLRCSSLGKDA
jgi:hypothetical protein